MTSTYGPAGLVGEWLAWVSFPRPIRSYNAVEDALRQLEPALAPLHRPSGLTASWREREPANRESAYHELESLPAATWPDLHRSVAALASAVVECAFVQLDTEVLDDTQVWLPGSAELQISLDPGQQDAVAGVHVRYATYIDVWLATTYGEQYRPRSNHHLAAANRPRLAAMLDGLAARVGGSLQAGQSQLYPFAITERGFNDVDDLPVRR